MDESLLEEVRLFLASAKFSVFQASQKRLPIWEKDLDGLTITMFQTNCDRIRLGVGADGDPTIPANRSS